MNYREHDHEQQRAIKAHVELNKFEHLTKYQVKKQQRLITQEAYKYNLKHLN